MKNALVLSKNNRLALKKVFIRCSTIYVGWPMTSKLDVLELLN